MTKPLPPVRRIAVTGSHGLIGTALTGALADAGFEVRRLDLRARGSERGDIGDRAAIERLIHGCVGIVHLAAVSRVIDGERNPEACWATNVEGTRNVLQAAQTGGRPWVVYASSREVYGACSTLPAREDTPRRPVNHYGRSKVEAEDLVERADLLSAILRFSNVYGWVGDHEDRVIPAFARQAATGRGLRVDGAGHTFDFTHVDDTVRGILAVVAKLEAGVSLPPIHLLTGTATTLGQLATLAVRLAGTSSSIHEASPRDYDVSHFYGDPARARELLNWQAQIDLRDGLARLIQDYRAMLGASEVA